MNYPKAPRRRRLAGVLFVATVAVAACGHSTAPTSPALGQDALDLLTRSGSFTRTDTLLTTATDVLTAACMRRAGFAYAAAPMARAELSDEDRIINLADRRQHGYNLLDSPASPAPPSPPGYREALDGRPGNLIEIGLPGGGRVTASRAGCLADSRRRLFGDLPTWAAVSMTPQRLNLQLGPRVAGDPALAAAQRRWRSCMAGHGYPYTSPDAALSQLATDYQKLGQTAVTRRREVAVAVADGQCAATAHIPSTVLALRRSYATQLAPADQRIMTELTHSWLAAAVVAQTVIP